LSNKLQPFFDKAGMKTSPEKLLTVTPLIRERIKLMSEAPAAADFFFIDELPPYDPAELIPQKGDAALAKRVLQTALEVLPNVTFEHDPLDQALRQAAASLGVKAGPMFQPIRVAVCGRKNAPPLFETMAVLGRDVCLERIRQAVANIEKLC
jgi:glutamyl-tRNA synthetase